MTSSSWEVGWRSLLVRSYDDPPQVDEFTTPPTGDQLIVLVTGGSCTIEGRYRGGWQSARYRPGLIGMTAPGQEVTLRWRGRTRHRTIQLHLPAATIRRVHEDLSDRDPSGFELPSGLSLVDPVIQSILVGLVDAVAGGAPDLYAETAGEFLAAHLLVRHAGLAEPRPRLREDARLRRALAFMRGNLATPVSLDAIARSAGLSRFHLVRLFKQAYGESPFRRLTRLRMEAAQRLLARSMAPVTEIAARCGYPDPAHFASAFRRLVCVSPSEYRRGAR